MAWKEGFVHMWVVLCSATLYYLFSSASYHVTPLKKIHKQSRKIEEGINYLNLTNIFLIFLALGLIKMYKFESISIHC